MDDKEDRRLNLWVEDADDALQGLMARVDPPMTMFSKTIALCSTVTTVRVPFQRAYFLMNGPIAADKFQLFGEDVIYVLNDPFILRGTQWSRTMPEGNS